jgi:signal transduction histidine kinase
MGGGSARRRSVAHSHPRDLIDVGRRRGYAQRVSPALPAWLGKPSPRVVDVLVAVVVGLPVIGTSVGNGAEQDRPLTGLVVGVVSVAALLVRRRWPFGTLVAILAIAVTSPVDAQFVLPLGVALYTIGSTRSWEAAFAGAALVVGTGFVYILAGGPGLAYEDLMATALACVVASGLGLYIGSKRSSVSALEERAARFDRERELLAERAVAEERVRIAQELHDVVAHDVSLIVVQAQALGATVPDPRVTAATGAIAELGREAMAEMHRTLKLLRARDDDRAELAPQPGLGDLDGLVERSRAAGLRVELAVEGEPRPLPQSVDLSAFRIVQEALTNVVKHAGRAETRVMVGYRPDGLELTVRDSGDPTGAAGARTAGGHGLIGMRERAALFGGTLSAGPCDGHGFEVRASLPYGEVAP